MLCRVDPWIFLFFFYLNELEQNDDFLWEGGICFSFWLTSGDYNLFQQSSFYAYLSNLFSF